VGLSASWRYTTDICRNELAIATHAALYIDKVGGLTDGTDAVSDLLSLRADALKLLARRVRFVCHLLQACGGPCRATWAAFFRCTAGVLQVPLHLRKPLLSLGGCLAGRPLLRGYRT
jgi:hypothetical protein